MTAPSGFRQPATSRPVREPYRVSARGVDPHLGVADREVTGWCHELTPMIEGSVSGPPVSLWAGRMTSARTSPLFVPRRADISRGGPEDLPLFSWVVLGDQARHVEGVSDDVARAVAAVSDALRTTVGSSGEVRTCRVCSFGRIEYVYGPVLARATLDRVTGSVVWGDA